MFNDRHITAIVPAHNEAPAIAEVLTALGDLIDPHGSGHLLDQIVVCDNGSTDGTAEIARQAGCCVVTESRLGYGAACQTAIKAAAPTDVLVFVDADRSVNVNDMKALLVEILSGAELVIGIRTRQLAEAGSMTVPQVFGNGLATFLIRWLWGVRVSDLGPFRAITTYAYDRLGMQDRRFGWTVEMQVRAIQERLDMREVPVASIKRIGQSKISGTVRGVIAAGQDILGTIFRLYIHDRRRAPQPRPIS